MVGSWLWQGLIGRFSTVFDKGWYLADVYLRLVWSLSRRRRWSRTGKGWCFPSADYGAVPELCIANHSCHAVTHPTTNISTQKMLVLPVLNHSDQIQGTHPPATVTQIMYKRTFTHEYTPTRIHKHVHSNSFTHILVQTWTFKHTHSLCMHKDVYLYNKTVFR